MQKYTIIVLTIVVVFLGIVVGAFAYNYKLLDESFSMCSDSSLKLTYKHQECIKRQNNSERNESGNESNQLNGYFSQYSNKPSVGKYAVYFEYPRNYSVIDYLNNNSGVPVYLSLITKQKDEDAINLWGRHFGAIQFKEVEVTKPLIEFYSEKKELYSGDKLGRKLTIQGKEYQSTMYTEGDGSYGGSDYFEGTVFQLEDDLFAEVIVSSSFLETYCSDKDNCELNKAKELNSNRVCQSSCENYKPEKFYSFQTSQEDIDNAYKILESLRWEKVK